MSSSDWMGNIVDDSLSKLPSFDGCGRTDNGLPVNLTPLVVVVSLRPVWTWSLIPVFSNKSGFPIGPSERHTKYGKGEGYTDETYVL